MEINERVLEIFREFKIFPDDGICYLISLFHGYKPTYIPEEIKKKINLTNIVEERDKNLHWNIPLYQGQTTNFEWVAKEYMRMFHQVNPERRGVKRSCIARMKKLFAKHPDIRKEEVLGATRMYLMATDSRYIRMSHYFIEKGTGATKTSDILEWIDRYREETKSGDGTTSITRKLQ